MIAMIAMVFKALHGFRMRNKNRRCLTLFLDVYLDSLPSLSTYAIPSLSMAACSHFFSQLLWVLPTSASAPAKQMALLGNGL